MGQKHTQLQHELGVAASVTRGTESYLLSVTRGKSHTFGMGALLADHEECSH
jgi:hypothetical protein